MNDAIHSIIKISALHFTLTEEYKKRAFKLREEPQRVVYAGALGVENIKT